MPDGAKQKVIADLLLKGFIGQWHTCATFTVTAMAGGAVLCKQLCSSLARGRRDGRNQEQADNDVQNTTMHN